LCKEALERGLAEAYLHRRNEEPWIRAARVIRAVHNYLPGRSPLGLREAKVLGQAVMVALDSNGELPATHLDLDNGHQFSPVDAAPWAVECDQCGAHDRTARCPAVRPDADLRGDLSRMVRLARDESWDDNRCELAAHFFVTRTETDSPAAPAQSIPPGEVPVRPDSHEIPGAWATPGLAGDTRHARARVAAMIDRFSDVSDLMVSVADLRALVALPAAPADDEAAPREWKPDPRTIEALMNDLLNEAAFAVSAGLADPAEVTHDDRVTAAVYRTYAEKLRAHPALAALREGQQQ
jgi:hypothetical protein